MPLKTQLDEQPTVNLTPMIDVVFILIIFFMVGTKFTELERKIRLQVPEVPVAGPLTPAPEKHVVNVHPDGRILLDQQQVTLKELTKRLAEARSQYQDLGVLIRGDGATRFQRMAEVLSACQQANVSELGISVRIARADKSQH